MSQEPDALVIGIDSSTTATKAICFTTFGEVVSEGRASIALHNPEADAYEQDADDWWQSTLEALSTCAAGLEPAARKRIRAVSITHQRETVVAIDQAFRPLSRALVWMDARCRPEVERACERLGRQRLHLLSGKPPCTTPSLYKLMYLLDRAHPELSAQAPLIADVHAFLCARLTGRFATSLASADPLGLVDMQRRTWSAELLSLAGLGSPQMPELLSPGARIGSILPEVAQRTGLPSDVWVYAGAGDGQAAGLGAGIETPGRAYLNLGTAIVSGVLSTQYRTANTFRTLYGAAPDRYFLETDLKGGTFIIDWLLDKWQHGRTLEQLEAEARRLPPGADGLMLVPYWNGVMNPYWDDNATGMVVGFHGAHTQAHLYRAILEGIAFEQRLHSTGVEADSKQRIDSFVLMGGGSKSRLWCEILADVLERPLTLSHTPEASALGAAILAAYGLRAHSNLEDAVAAMTRKGASVTPGPHRALYQRLYTDVYRKLYPALHEPLVALSALREQARSES